MDQGENIFNRFTESQIPQVWDELKDRFGFNIAGWKTKYRAYFNTQARNVIEKDCFLKFGSVFINPVLNQLLCRPESNPTFQKMIEYIVQRNGFNPKKRLDRVR